MKNLFNAAFVTKVLVPKDLLSNMKTPIQMPNLTNAGITVEKATTMQLPEINTRNEFMVVFKVEPISDMKSEHI